MKSEQILADYKAWTTKLNNVLEDLIELAGEHNPQSPEMELLAECPKDHPHCCGHCEIIHRAREFKTNWGNE